MCFTRNTTEHTQHEQFEKWNTSFYAKGSNNKSMPFVVILFFFLLCGVLLLTASTSDAATTAAADVQHRCVMVDGTNLCGTASPERIKLAARAFQLSSCGKALGPKGGGFDILPSALGGVGVFARTGYFAGELIELCPTFQFDTENTDAEGGDRLNVSNLKIIEGGAVTAEVAKTVNLLKTYAMTANGFGRRESYLSGGYCGFCNHGGKTSNTAVMDRLCGGITSTALYAVRDIAAGEEILWNYGTDYFRDRGKTELSSSSSSITKPKDNTTFVADAVTRKMLSTHAFEPTAVTGKMLSTSPRILQYQKLLLKKETSFLINSVRKRMTTSPHGKGIYTGKKQGDGPHRTSTAGFLTPRQEASLLGKSIMKKLFAASTHPSTHAEVLQIEQYQVGGKYSCHFNPFWDKNKSAMVDPDLLLGGQRVKTLITYLYDTPLGGETVFPCASKLSTTTRSFRLDFKEIGIDEVCKNNYEQDKTLLVQKPIQGTSLLFHHYLPNGRTFDLRSWHCSCPVRPSKNNADSENTKWIAQLWLRGESLVMYRDPSLIAMWSIDDEILNVLGFESICPSSTNACPHNGRLTFKKGSEGRYKRKTNGLRQFYVFMPGSTMLISEPNIFATVLKTRSVSVVVSLQLPTTLATKTSTPLLTIQGRTSKFFLDFNDIDASHTQSRRIFTLLLSLDFTNEKEIVMVGKVGSFGTEGADLKTLNVSIQHIRGVSSEKFDWTNARLVIGNSDLNVPLAVTEVLTFDRIFSLKEMETILTLPTTEMLGWDKNELQ